MLFNKISWNCTIDEYTDAHYSFEYVKVPNAARYFCLTFAFIDVNFPGEFCYVDHVSQQKFDYGPIRTQIGRNLHFNTFLERSEEVGFSKIDNCETSDKSVFTKCLNSGNIFADPYVSPLQMCHCIILGFCNSFPTNKPSA